MATCQHTWSEKTMRYFPPLIREHLTGRMDKRVHATQAWQQAETTVINQCKQLLSPSADPSYVMTYINHSFPQHRKYLCAGAWMLMHSHPDTINFANLDILLKASGNLAVFVWKHELFPLDILILALIDRDDDPHALRIVISLLERPEIPQRIKLFCINRGPPEHWLHSGISKRTDLQKALGNHLSWKESFEALTNTQEASLEASNTLFPPFFDDLTGRFCFQLFLVVYRLIENDAHRSN
ncbi:hypothetical protein Scep_022776 [Stephania cephalantha]|uniref:Uncharacterized protein n=1 Tax=Stephania cephalantha TaxID=152367 RepID=A0AAP0FC62_9MAGN